MDNYKFFQNTNCEFFPCHNCDIDEFNCIFCHCPLYPLGKECGGNFTFLENGKKSCENCNIPHTRIGYEHIMKNINKIVDMVRNKD